MYLYTHTNIYSRIVEIKGSGIRQTWYWLYFLRQLCKHLKI